MKQEGRDRPNSGWLTMQQAADLVGPRKAGKPTTARTIRTWAVIGLQGVKLRFRDNGGVMQTRKKWVREFQAAYAAVKARIRAARPTPALPVSARDRRLQARAKKANQQANAG